MQIEKTPDGYSLDVVGILPDMPPFIGSWAELVFGAIVCWLAWRFKKAVDGSKPQP